MIGIFALFYVQGFYPLWFLLLIAASFIQFLATSPIAKKIYDPVGRYLGSALYIGVVLTFALAHHSGFSVCSVRVCRVPCCFPCESYSEFDCKKVDVASKLI